MLISIITPTYNRGRYPFLKNLCQSIAIAKKYDDLSIEHLIVNDGSNDNTEQVLLDLQQTFPYIKYFKNTENKGVTFSKNLALSEAKGELVMDMDDDDLVPFYALGLRSKLLLASDKTWLCGNAIQINEEGLLQFTDNLLGRFVDNKWECFQAFYEGKLFAYAGTRIYYREALERIHGWNENITSVCEDFDLWLRLTYYGGSPAFSHIPLIYWRMKECSLGINALKSGEYIATISAFKSCYRALYEESLQKVEVYGALHSSGWNEVGAPERSPHAQFANQPIGQRAPTKYNAV